MLKGQKQQKIKLKIECFDRFDDRHICFENTEESGPDSTDTAGKEQR